MIYLVDTNILLRFADRGHILQPMVRSAVRKLRASSDSLQTTSQNFIEFWNVATHPAAINGLGLSPIEADRLLRLVERLFSLLVDSPLQYVEWRKLVVNFHVSGVQVHDARLVTFMRVHGLTHILTLNTSGFARYAPLGIVAVDPRTV